MNSRLRWVWSLAKRGEFANVCTFIKVIGFLFPVFLPY